MSIECLTSSNLIFFPATYIFAFTGNNRKVPADVAEHTQNIVLEPISPNGTHIQKSAENKQQWNIEPSSKKVIDQSKKALLQKQKQKRPTLRKALNKWKTMAFETIIDNN